MAVDQDIIVLSTIKLIPTLFLSYPTHKKFSDPKLQICKEEATRLCCASKKHIFLKFLKLEIC